MANRPIRERRQTKPFIHKESNNPCILAGDNYFAKSTADFTETPLVKQELDQLPNPLGATREGRGDGGGGGGGGGSGGLSIGADRGNGRRRGWSHNHRRNRAGTRPLKRQRIDNDGRHQKTLDLSEPSSGSVGGEQHNGVRDFSYNHDEPLDLHDTCHDQEAKFHEGFDKRVPNYPTESDPVIEQWYEDPYQRIAPDGPAYDQWRRQNIETGFFAFGMNVNGVKDSTNYLMKRRGQWQLESEQTRGATGKKRKRNRNKRKRKEQASQDDDITPQPANVNPRVEEDDLVADLVALGDDPGLDGSSDGEGDEEAPDTMSGTSLPFAAHTAGDKVQRKLSRLAVSNASRDSTAIQYQHDYENVSNDMKIATIKSRLRQFEALYPSDRTSIPGSRPQDLELLELEYMSGVTNLPRSVPKRGFSTQGHFSLCETNLPDDSLALTNHIVKTHVPTLCPPSSKSPPCLSNSDPSRISEKASDPSRSSDQSPVSDKPLLLDQRQTSDDSRAPSDHSRSSKSGRAIKHPPAMSSELKLAHNQTIPHNPTVYTEDSNFGLSVFPPGVAATTDEQGTWSGTQQEENEEGKDDIEPLPSLDAHVGEATAPAATREAVLQQLFRKQYTWETIDSMQGYWVSPMKDEAGMRTGRRDQFGYFPEDPSQATWRLIQRRLDILATGGDAADELILKEDEEAMEEAKRLKRHEERARAKERKKAKTVGHNTSGRRRDKKGNGKGQGEATETVVADGQGERLSGWTADD